MEPAINTDLTSSVDLTRYAFEDIGWLPRTTDVPAGTLPAIAALRPNAPNPFAHSTSIRFDVPRDAETDLGVYDISGRLVRNLLHGRFPAGSHVVVWDGIGADGQRVRDGVYFTRLKVGGEVALPPGRARPLTAPRATPRVRAKAPGVTPGGLRLRQGRPNLPPAVSQAPAHHPSTPARPAPHRPR